LVATGFVGRTAEGRYWLTDKANNPDVDRLVAKNVDLVIDTANALQVTKMNTGVTKMVS
jgi:hypothetical protein